MVDECDWSDVRRAFPLSHIKVDHRTLLRPLSIDDLEELCGFMCDDPEMTWTRTRWSKKNVEYLLNLRLEHYQAYGFGPYAVEYDEKLQGMAGVQIWPEESCSVEVLAYVSRSLWSKHVGTNLINWTIDRAKREGLKELYAATRLENRRAQFISKKLGMKEIGRGEHFGHSAIKWIIKL